MPSSTSPDGVHDGEAFEEVDPTGRFGRYSDLLGAGAVKKVYRGFDQEEGIEVAWNRVRLWGMAEQDPAMLERLFAEVRLLRSLRHERIIAFYKMWTDSASGMLNFITEVKIGDLGLAAIVDKTHVAHTILGTPEFMAPELYEEDYTESVDIYSFGMCVLEMVTREVPYAECDSIAKIYRKVSSGVRPAALDQVEDLEMRAFIERCLGRPRDRPSAAELLEDPFFDGLDDDNGGLF